MIDNILKASGISYTLLCLHKNKQIVLDHLYGYWLKKIS